MSVVCNLFSVLSFLPPGRFWSYLTCRLREIDFAKESAGVRRKARQFWVEVALLPIRLALAESILTTLWQNDGAPFLALLCSLSRDLVTFQQVVFPESPTKKRLFSSTPKIFYMQVSGVFNNPFLLETKALCASRGFLKSTFVSEKELGQLPPLASSLVTQLPPTGIRFRFSNISNGIVFPNLYRIV